MSGAGDELDRLAQNLNVMLDRIARLMEGIRQVSDNIAHDLRTPLTRLRNHAEQALRARGEAASRDALERVIEEADGLIRIFNALLLIARAEALSSSEGFADLDGEALAADMAELYEPSAEERGVRIKVNSQRAKKFRGNRELIGQALANLIDNALKHGAPALPGAVGEVRVTVTGDARAVEISVGDRGPGIPAADRERVLDRFVRLEVSRSRPGSGLGLSLAAAVARLHGGALRIEDNAPGLKVTLRLPQGEPRHDQALALPRPAQPATARARLDEFFADAPERAELPQWAAFQPLALGLADQSPFLWGLIRRDPERLARVLRENPEAALDAALARLAECETVRKPAR